MKLAHAEQQYHRIQPTLISPGSSHHPFLFSTLPGFDLVRCYRLKAFGAMVRFFLTATAAVWLLGVRRIQ